MIELRTTDLDLKWLKFIRELDSKKHEYYRGVDLTRARKFQTFHRWLKIPDVPLTRFYKIFPFWVDRIENKIDQMKNWIKEENIKLLEVDEDMSVLSNCRVQVAKLLGIPTRVRIHGCLCSLRGFVPVEADKISVWDSRQRDKLIMWGVPDYQIEVEGWDRRYGFWMSWNAKREIVREDVKRYFELRDVPLVIITPSELKDFGDGYEEKKLSMIKNIVFSVRNFSKIDFIIKIHPGANDRKQWKKWLPQKNVRVVRDYRTMELIIASDLLLSQNSTCALDGYALGKNVVITDDGTPSGCEEFEGAFPKVSTVHEISSQFSELL